MTSRPRTRADDAEPASGTFSCEPNNGRPWTFVAAGQAGYVIGNYSNDTTIERSAKSALVENEGRHYDGGFVGGSFNGCGWIPENRDVQTSTAGVGPEGCAHSRPLAKFASLVDCAPGCPGDATPVNPVAACPFYANYRPWSAEAAPAAYLGDVQPAPAGSALRWRYVTRDGQYVMTRVEGMPADTGNAHWGFVPRGCLPPTLPPGEGGVYTP